MIVTGSIINCHTKMSPEYGKAVFYQEFTSYKVQNLIDSESVNS